MCIGFVPPGMRERAQFLWGVGALVLWLVTVIFSAAYLADARDLRLKVTMREAFHWKDSLSYWESKMKVASGNVTYWNSVRSGGLAMVGCGGVDSGDAPMCRCLGGAVTTAQGSCMNRGRSQMRQCFVSARPVQKVKTVSDGIRPYMILLMINTWAGLVGAVLLVRSKLVEKNGYAVQLVIQALLLVVAVGGACMWFVAPAGEWVVLLLVSLILIASGWYANDEVHWCSTQFALMYCAVLPMLGLLANVMYDRRDLLYLVSILILSLVVALVVSSKIMLDRVADTPGVMVGRFTLFIVAVVLCGVVYDASFAPPVLKSAPYVWKVYVIYMALGMLHVESMELPFSLDLMLRSVLTVAMVVELM